MYLGGGRFVFRPGHQVSLLRFSVIFLSFSKIVLPHIRLCLLPSTSLTIRYSLYHPVIERYAALLNKLQIRAPRFVVRCVYTCIVLLVVWNSLSISEVLMLIWNIFIHLQFLEIVVVIIIVLSNIRPSEICYGHYKTESFHRCRGFPRCYFLLALILKHSNCGQNSSHLRIVSNFFCIIV
jgi:hypothetical protein